MLNFLNKIKNKAKRYFSFRKINPHKQWMVIIYIFSFLVIILGLFSFYLLSKVKKQEIFKITSNPGAETVIINENLLKKVQEYFLEKKIREQEIRNGGLLYKDPSFN